MTLFIVLGSLCAGVFLGYREGDIVGPLPRLAYFIIAAGACASISLAVLWGAVTFSFGSFFIGSLAAGVAAFAASFTFGAFLGALLPPVQAKERAAAPSSR